MVTSFSFENTSTDTPVCLPPIDFLCSFCFIFCLLPSSRIFFSLRAVNGLSLVWHHWVFPMHLPQSCSGVRQISLQWACSHCLYSLVDAGMLEVTHKSNSAFHAYSWHPIEATHRVCVWVWSPAPCGPVLVLPCFAVPLHLLIECCFEMLTLYKRKRKCKKKKNSTHKQTHTICICIYTCPYKYT